MIARQPGARFSAMRQRPSSAAASAAVRGRASVPGFPAALSSPRVRRRGRGVAERPIDEIAGPAVRDDHAGERDDEEGQGRPDADDVVPVEVARLSGEPALKEADARDAADAAQPRPPDVEARKRQPEEEKIRRSGDRLPGGPAILGKREPAVDVLDFAEELAPAGGGGSEDGARRAVEEERALASERDGGGLRGIRAHRHGGGSVPGRRFGGEAEERAGGDRLGRRLRPRGLRNAAHAALDEPQDLRLEGEQHAGDAHRENDGSRERPRREVAPEEDPPEGSHRVSIILRLSLIVSGK